MWGRGVGKFTCVSGDVSPVGATRRLYYIQKVDVDAAGDCDRHTCSLKASHHMSKRPAPVQAHTWLLTKAESASAKLRGGACAEDHDSIESTLIDALLAEDYPPRRCFLSFETTAKLRTGSRSSHTTPMSMSGEGSSVMPPSNLRVSTQFWSTVTCSSCPPWFGNETNGFRLYT